LIVTQPSNNFGTYSLSKLNLEIQIQQFENPKNNIVNYNI